MPYLEPERVQISRVNGACYLSFDARDRQNGDAIHLACHWVLQMRQNQQRK